MAIGRPNKLNERQLDEAREMLLAGKSFRTVGKVFKVSPNTIKAGLSDQCVKIKTIANTMVCAETALNQLPISAQRSTRALVNRLLTITDDLAEAAENGAKTSKHLAQIANKQAMGIDTADPMEDVDKLQSVAALTKLANDSATLGISLIRIATPKEREDSEETYKNPKDMTDDELYAIATGCS